MSNIDGIINIMKPSGMTSYRVVSSVRKILSSRKAGHTGTLDPAAIGVLPVCLGKATKIIPFISEEEKEYIADINLGVVTDTLDGEGKIISKSDGWQDINIEQVNNALKDFLGKIEQIPPMYSAIHHDGKRLYQIARQGKDVEREARKIEIKEIELLDMSLPLIKIRVLCSRGTYIRSLADDIGKKLKVGAHLSALTRIKSGPFTLENAVSLLKLEKTGKKNLLPIDYPINFPRMYIKENALRFAQNGVELYRHNFKKIPENLLDYLEYDNRVSIYYENLFISINSINNFKEDNFECKPLRVFNTS